MAGDRDPWPLWAQEATGTSGRPRIASVLLLIVILAAVILFAGPDATARGPQRTTSLCEQHAGRPGWTTVCEK
jgi:hypothetical protein